MTNDQIAGFRAQEISGFSRPLESLNLANRAALVGGGLYGLRKDWIAAARAEAQRAAYREDHDFDGVFTGIDADAEGAIYEAIIA